MNLLQYTATAVLCAGCEGAGNNQIMKVKRPKTIYAFLKREGPLMTDRDQDDLARMVAAMILRHLRYKNETGNIPNVEE